jgi:phage gp36-like protein
LAYIAKQDLLDELGEDKLIQLTDNERSGTVDDAVVNKAIAYAEGLFDSYARTRYALPVPVTEMVKSVCLDLAVYKLRRARTSTKEAMDSLKSSLYDSAIKVLEAIQKGTAALDVPAAEESVSSPASPDAVLKGTSKSQFGDDKIGGY